MSVRSSKSSHWLLGFVISGMLLASGCWRSSERVVVYCAQDRHAAERSFAEFEKETGLSIAPKYDTEANKSVALVAELQLEATRPRADVHWNNEILGTIRLARAGIYQPYESPATVSYPSWSRGPKHLFQAFAERARVIIVNTKLVPPAERPQSMFDLIDPKWRGKMAMAKPQFGTTATHAACLFEVLGPETAANYFRALKANGMQIVAGNKPVAVGVGEGRFALGWTDTDDAILELKAGKPVALIFPDREGHPEHPRLGTLFIPNTVAIVAGSPNLAGARKLVDYLLRPSTETMLSGMGAYQIPVNPLAESRLPPEIVTRKEVTAMAVDFERAADLWESTQAFLREEFAR
jgi:iron(III) transport system substrate-binding protein